MRFLPNPYYVPELKTLNGLDAPVRDYVFQSEQTAEFLRRLTPLVEFLLPQYRQEGRTELVIAVGCTGGRHRSVAVAHYLAEFAMYLGYPVTESHRDMNRLAVSVSYIGNLYVFQHFYLKIPVLFRNISTYFRFLIR